jgi:ketosteroid isomerase-like protein
MQINEANIRETIAKLNQQWDAAFNDAQPQAVAAFYDEAATLMPAGAPQVHGSPEIGQFWGNVISQGFTNHKIELIDAGVDQQLAFQRAKWSAAATNADGVKQIYSGSLHLLYRRQADSGWKVLTHIWN